MYAIVAVDEKWGIGRDNRLLFHLPADLKRFKELTSGHTVLMLSLIHISEPTRLLCASRMPSSA